jgi:cell division protease FtsH
LKNSKKVTADSSFDYEKNSFQSMLDDFLKNSSQENEKYNNDFLLQLQTSINYAKENLKELDIKDKYSVVSTDVLYDIDDKYYSLNKIHISSIFLPIKNIALSKDTSYLQKLKNHYDAITDKGYGINLYKLKETEIYFAIITIPTSIVNSESVSLFLCKKGYMFKILLKYKQYLKHNVKDPQKPILGEKMFNSIINNSIGLLKSKKELDKWNIKIKKGLLLTGPPGNGKTTMCKYIRDECTKMGYSYTVIENSELSACVAQNKSLSDLINGVDVSFFDDIDVDYFNRGSSQATIACSLLTALDGMVDNKYSIRIFSTNEEVQDLDPAFCRPGRIDHIFEFKLPSAKLRKQYFESFNIELKDYINNNNIKIIEDTDGLSFADLEFIRTQMIIEYIQSDKWNYQSILKDLVSRKEEVGSAREKIGFGL